MHMIKDIINKLMLMIAMIALFSSCSSDNDRELFFIGDSLVARWDLTYWFPTYITHNDGISGSGIAHIQECAGRYADKEVVVIVGTNDMHTFSQEDDAEYVKNYVEAIQALGAKRIYLFSVFPKSKGLCYGPEDDNEKIKRINNKIKYSIQDKQIVYIDVYNLLELNGSINMQYSYDGLHLSHEGYELITKQLKKVL